MAMHYERTTKIYIFFVTPIKLYFKNRGCQMKSRNLEHFPKTHTTKPAPTLKKRITAYDFLPLAGNHKIILGNRITKFSNPA